MNGSKIDSIIPAIKWHLKLEIISIILRGVCYFAHKLSNMSVGFSTLLSLFFCLNEIVII